MAEKKVSKAVSDTAVTFEFATGEVVEVSPKDFSGDIQKQLMLHGLSQKLGDSYSGEDADKCHSIFTGVLVNLNEGNWSARAGGGGSPRISQLAEALALETGETVEKCVEILSAMDDDKKKAVRVHPAIQVQLSQIKLKKAAADAEKLKAELGGKEVAPLTLQGL